MNAGKLESSPRLRATLAALRTGELSTLQISQRTFSVAVHSDVAALRANGIAISVRREGGRWYYRLVEPIPRQAEIFEGARTCESPIG
jgi:hypothetical protein